MQTNGPSLSRRALLKSAACGFGSLAMAGMQGAYGLTGNPLAAKDPLIPQRAKRVIFIFMAGGPSHVDTFDYKPELFAKDRKEIDFTGVRTGTFGKQSKRKLMKPMWDFMASAASTCLRSFPTSRARWTTWPSFIPCIPRA